jgi:hypothetical protein
MLDSVGLLLSSYLEGEALYDLLPSSRAIDRRGRGCVHVNHELNTHTFLETVDTIRSASMIVSVQGSQLFDAIFAKQEAFLIEMVPTHETIAMGGSYVRGTISQKKKTIAIGGSYVRGTISQSIFCID